MKEELLTMDGAVAAKGRGFLYGLFAQAYLKEPSAPLLGFLSSCEAAPLLASLGIDAKVIAPEGRRDECLKAMAEEYAALFVMPGGVSPFESVRTKGLLCQEPEWKAREFYLRCGLSVPEGSNVFADHIGVELDFMGYLARKESEAWKKGGEEEALNWLLLEKDFFKGHINGWAFGLLDDVIRYSAHPFYMGVSLLARNFLLLEKEDLLTGC